MKRILLSTLGIAVLAVANGSTALAGLFDPDVYDRGLTMGDYMRQVPGGGQPGGPAYDFGMGMYEITNAQFAAFLNDAQLDGGATGRGSNMYFQDDGRVRISPGGPTLFRGGPQVIPSPMIYDPSGALGQRWSVRPMNGMDMGPHPVWNVSWFGAAKFANWLTLDQGLPASERAYTEGPNPQDWHPATISTSEWQTRDLNVTERQSLVDNYNGFRLPMDGGTATASPYNEFYKAAAWDPAAQINHTYGFGRDGIDNLDANGEDLHPLWFSGLKDDPFEVGTGPDTTPVGFYDGTLWQRSDWNWPDASPTFDTFQTRANANAHGIFDLSGNVMEWMQDQFPGTSFGERTQRGGHFGLGPSNITTTSRQLALPDSTNDTFGLRMVRVPEPASLALLLLALLAVSPRQSRRGTGQSA